jgi:hypothetical protein
MKRFIKLFLFLFLVFLASSCAKKNLEVFVPPVIEYKIKDRTLVKTLDSLSALKPNRLYAKIKVEFKDNYTDVIFKTSLKLERDSLLNAIVTKAGFPIANALISLDSVKILNILEKCFVKNSWDSFRELLNIEIDYFNLENILLGRPLTDAFNQKYFVEKEQFDKQLTNTSIDSTINAPIESLLIGELMVNYILTEDLKDISQTRIFRALDSTEIGIKYVKRQVISGFNLPYDIIISFSRPSYNLIARMEYEKLELNKDLKINFVIPQKYEVCN